MSTSTITDGELPPGFIWGAATSAYQIEGAVDQDGRGPSIWDVFSHTPGMTYREDNGDVACDSFNRSDEDLALIGDLGLTSYRFSIAWPRIQPDGVHPNAQGLDYYERLVDGLLARGTQPAATLFHWDLPQSLQEQGGWAARETVDRFADYAQLVASRLGDRVKMWFTINEPWVAAWVGHGLGRHAPGIRDLRTAAAAHHHLLLAHGRATQVLRNALPAKTEVGLALSMMSIRRASDSAGDVAAADVVDAQFNLSCADPIFGRPYPANLDVFSRTWQDPDGPCKPGDMETIAIPIDFLGVNTYHARTVASRSGLDAARARGLIGQYDESLAFGMDCADVLPVGAPTTATGWPVNPDGLRDLLLRLHQRYQVPLYVAENGIALHDYIGPDNRVRDTERSDYLHQHVAAVKRASALGANVRGYFAWSLLDNFEWSAGYAPRFGLVYVDYPSARRIKKDSFDVYRSIIASNARDIPALR